MASEDLKHRTVRQNEDYRMEQDGQKKKTTMVRPST